MASLLLLLLARLLLTKLRPKLTPLLLLIAPLPAVPLKVVLLKVVLLKAVLLKVVKQKLAKLLLAKLPKLPTHLRNISADGSSGCHRPICVRAIDVLSL